MKRGKYHWLTNERELGIIDEVGSLSLGNKKKNTAQRVSFVGGNFCKVLVNDFCGENVRESAINQCTTPANLKVDFLELAGTICTSASTVPCLKIEFR